MKAPVKLTRKALARLLSVLLMTAPVCGTSGAATPTFKLTSEDLPAGKSFTDQLAANAFGCHGGNASPALHWSGAPAGTRSFAVTMFDTFQPPPSGWWHWVVFDIPVALSGLPHGAGAPGSADFPKGARQGLYDGDTPERHYIGPCPDLGDPPHRYVITVYALSVDHLDIPETATSTYIAYVISSKAIAKASIARNYSR